MRENKRNKQIPWKPIRKQCNEIVNHSHSLSQSANGSHSKLKLTKIYHKSHKQRERLNLHYVFGTHTKRLTTSQSNVMYFKRERERESSRVQARTRVNLHCLLVGEGWCKNIICTETKPVCYSQKQIQQQTQWVRLWVKKRKRKKTQANSNIFNYWHSVSY